MDKYNLTNDIINQLVQKINTEAKINVNTNKGYQNMTFVNQHVLAVFTGTSFGLNEVLRELSKARRYGFTFDVAVSDNGIDVIGSDGLQSIKTSLKPCKIYTEEDKLVFGEIIESVDGIIVPMTTQDTAAKLALGIQDNFVSTLLWQALWHGKSMLVDFHNVSTYRGNKSQTLMLQQIMDDYIDRIQKMGVTRVERKDYVVQMLNVFKNSVSEEPQVESTHKLVSEENITTKNVITEKDLLELSTHRKELTVPMRAIITPLAYDTAKQLGIKIIKR
ncbi:flavoprotein [Brassicibacter mesophilus]|uniref:flavoprotein n=1 Tax=Brassicibacter mesophilus TaxID=745119 RepID=UPI003D1BCB65